MKTGISLSALAAKIEGNKSLKHDLVAPANLMTAVADPDGVVKLAVGDASFPILNTAHNQIGARLEIPARYYDRMRVQAPALLVANLNEWLHRSPEKRMCRTLAGDLRAFMSNSYQRIEHEEIAEVVLPALAEVPGGIEIKSCEITERRMYILAVSKRLEKAVKVGDVVQAGVSISNSEIGHGAAVISPLIWRLMCLNGMICPDSRFAARHVGRRIDVGEDLNGIFADDTKQADDRAILLKVRDTVRAALDEVQFAGRVERMQALTQVRVTGDPQKSVEVLAKKIGATDGERGGILRSLIEGGDLSAWGLLNAVTHQAHTASSYDRAVEFAAAGGSLLTLPRSEWREVLEAA